MTRSYALARTLPGSLSSIGRSSSIGAVNGWWFAAQRFSSSSQMNDGKSTTQAILKSFFAGSYELQQRRPGACAALPSAWQTTSSLSATNSSRSPGSAASRCAQRLLDRRRAGTSRSATVNLSASTLTQARPLAP